jgi:hypothetical protein
MSKLGAFAIPALLAAWAAPAPGEDVARQADVSAPAACACRVIPALTPVSIEILAPLGSKISKSGESFPIRLAAPILIDGKEAVPAGALGVGEVIHAKKSGGMGAAGELVLAARYVEVDGQRLMLRSLNIAAAGESSIHKVDAINAASAASPLPIGLIGFFISGGQVNVAQGTVAPAKTRESFTLPPLAGLAPAVAGPATANIASKGE